MVVCLLAVGILCVPPAPAAQQKKNNNRNRNQTMTATRRVSDPADWELVKFLGSYNGRQWDEPVMFVDVQSVRGGRTVSLVIHNSGWKKQQNDTYRRQKRATKPEVPPAMLRVLKKHKVGDVIAIRAQTIDRATALHSVKEYKGKPGEFAPDSALFVKAETKDSGSGRSVTRVTLSKFGKTSVLPLMQIHDKDEKGRPTHTTREDLVKAAGGFTNGDLVEVDVGTDRGMRVIRHIARWQEPHVGQFAQLGQKEIDGVNHVTVQIRSKLGAIPFLVQQTISGGKYTDDYRMARFVKTLKPNQYVAFKTRRQNDNTILWLIGGTDKTSSKRDAKPAANNKGDKRKKKPK